MSYEYEYEYEYSLPALSRGRRSLCPPSPCPPGPPPGAAEPVLVAVRPRVSMGRITRYTRNPRGSGTVVVYRTAPTCKSARGESFARCRFNVQFLQVKGS
eukprot:scaffold416512_cov23-Prasinocladus_malaysianus.AAC.1